MKNTKYQTDEKNLKIIKYEIIAKHPLYGRIKKYWKRKYGYDKKWTEELDSLAGLLLAEISVKHNDTNPFDLLNQTLERLVKEIEVAEKEITYKDNRGPLSLNTIQKIEKEDRKDDAINKEIKKLFNIFGFKKNSKLPKKILKELPLKYKNNCIPLPKFSAKLKIPYDRLRYYLKKIEFPVIKTETNRYYIYANENLSFSLKRASRLKDNSQKWIAFLKKKGWEKSKISKFMSRKIEKKIVPKHYFHIVPPKQKFFLDLKKAKKRPLNTLPDRLLWELSSVPSTEKDVLNFLSKTLRF